MKSSSAFLKLFSICAISISLLYFAACSRTGSNTQSAASSTGSIDALAKILGSKKISVCYAVWPPAVIKDAKTGQLSGHDIDAITLMASQIGVVPEFHETTFGNMAAAIQSGQCDIGTSLFVKIPRAAAVAFTQPIFYAGNSALVRKGDKRFRTINDVDKPGIKVAVATGESGHIYAKDHFKFAQIIPVDVESSDLSRFLLEVTSGRADIGIADAITIALFAKTHPESEDIFANKPFDINPNSYPVRLGEQNLLNFVNNSLLYMETSGKWQELENKYNAHWLHEVKIYRVQ